MDRIGVRCVSIERDAEIVDLKYQLDHFKQAYGEKLQQIAELLKVLSEMESMEYGILVATAEDGSFQIIGTCDSWKDGNRMADEYLANAPDRDYLVPNHFQIHRRSDDGAYTNIVHVRFK